MISTAKYLERWIRIANIYEPIGEKKERGIRLETFMILLVDFWQGFLHGDAFASEYKRWACDSLVIEAKGQTAQIEGLIRL
jgi:hypothetical protein